MLPTDVLLVFPFVDDDDDANAVLFALFEPFGSPVDDASLVTCVYVTYNDIVSTLVAINNNTCSGIANTVKGGANSGS